MAGKQLVIRSSPLLAGDGQSAGTAGNHWPAQAAGVAGTAGIAGTVGLGLWQAEGKRLVALGSQWPALAGSTAGSLPSLVVAAEQLLAETEEELLAGTAAWEAAWAAA